MGIDGEVCYDFHLYEDGEGLCVTLPGTNIAPENGWLEYLFPFGKAYCQGPC